MWNAQSHSSQMSVFSGSSFLPQAAQAHDRHFFLGSSLHSSQGGAEDSEFSNIGISNSQVALASRDDDDEDAKLASWRLSLVKI